MSRLSGVLRQPALNVPKDTSRLIIKYLISSAMAYDLNSKLSSVELYTGKNEHGHQRKGRPAEGVDVVTSKPFMAPDFCIFTGGFLLIDWYTFRKLDF